jgi:hypothetical protein
MDNTSLPTNQDNHEEQFKHAVIKFVKGATDENCTDFITRVLTPEGVTSAKELEDLAAEAKLRDRTRCNTDRDRPGVLDRELGRSRSAIQPRQRSAICHTYRRRNHASDSHDE